MFGTDAAQIALYDLVSPLAEVQAFAAADHVVGLPLLPEGMVPPGVLIHPDPASLMGQYDPRPVSVGVLPINQTVDMVVRLIAPGETTDPIEAPAYAQLAAVDGKTRTVTVRSRQFTVYVWAIAEWTQTFLILRDGSTARQLGTIYRCQITAL